MPNTELVKFVSRLLTLLDFKKVLASKLSAKTPFVKREAAFGQHRAGAESNSFLEARQARYVIIFVAAAP